MVEMAGEATSKVDVGEATVDQRGKEEDGAKAGATAGDKAGVQVVGKVAPLMSHLEAHLSADTVALTALAASADIMATGEAADQEVRLEVQLEAHLEAHPRVITAASATSAISADLVATGEAADQEDVLEASLMAAATTAGQLAPSTVVTRLIHRNQKPPCYELVHLLELMTFDLARNFLLHRQRLQRSSCPAFLISRLLRRLGDDGGGGKEFV